MKIYLASDHAGFELKEKLKKFLAELEYETKDFGAFEFNPEDDYPDFIIPAIRALQNDLENNIDALAIILGGSGQGEAVCANRFKGIRAIVYYGFSEEIVKLGKEHNNSNVLSLGSRFISEEETKRVVKLWLLTPFPNPSDKNFFRHQKRIEKIDK